MNLQELLKQLRLLGKSIPRAGIYYDDKPLGPPIWKL